MSAATPLPHKAADPVTIATTVRALRRNGWSSDDIAKAMRVSIDVVVAALRSAT
jgi:hypothetical protein